MKKLKIMIHSTLILNAISIAKPAYANAACYFLADDRPPTVGYYFDCMLPKVWPFIQGIFIAGGVIIFMYSILQYVMNRSNSKFLETFNQKMLFLLAGVLLIAGFGTSLIDIFLKVMGLGSIEIYLELVNEFVKNWDYFN